MGTDCSNLLQNDVQTLLSKKETIKNKLLIFTAPERRFRVSGEINPQRSCCSRLYKKVQQQLHTATTNQLDDDTIARFITIKHTDSHSQPPQTNNIQTTRQTTYKRTPNQQKQNPTHNQKPKQNPNHKQKPLTHTSKKFSQTHTNSPICFRIALTATKAGLSPGRPNKGLPLKLNKETLSSTGIKPTNSYPSF